MSEAGLLQYPFREMPSLQEGIVTSIDPIRSVASVRTFRGQRLVSVPWMLPSSGYGSGLEGQYFTPSVSSKVLISTATGFPIIIGTLPRTETPETNFSISNNPGIIVDTGNSSPLQSFSQLNSRKPSDLLPGDVISSDGMGSFLGILKTGSIIARSSNLAQLFISKLGRLVRIVGANYQRFSDASSRVTSSAQGRLYEWFGVDKSLANNKEGLERYNEAFGDVAAAEVLLGTPSSTNTLPAPDDRIRKHWLKNSSGVSVMTETLYDDGKLILNINTPGSTTITTDDQLWKAEVLSSSGGSGSVITVQPDVISIAFHGSDTTLVIDASGTRIDSKSHYMHIDSSGVHLG